MKKEDFDRMSDDELRQMFSNPTGGGGGGGRKQAPGAPRPQQQGQPAGKKKDGPGRKLTLDELLTSPLSNIFEVRVGQANILRAAGNDNFKLANYELAIKLYERALKHCAMDEDRLSAETQKLKQQMYEGRDPIYLNLARSYLKTGRFRDCVNSAKSVSRTQGVDNEYPVPLELELKALVIAANGFIELGEYAEADDALTRATARFQAEADKPPAEGGPGLDKLRALIESTVPSLRQAAKVRAAQDRRTQRQMWRGALWGPSPPVAGAGAGAEAGAGAGAGAGAVNSGAEGEGLPWQLLRRPLLLCAVVVLVLALAGAAIL